MKFKVEFFIKIEKQPKKHQTLQKDILTRLLNPIFNQVTKENKEKNKPIIGIRDRIKSTLC